MLYRQRGRGAGRAVERGPHRGTGSRRPGAGAAKLSLLAGFAALCFRTPPGLSARKGRRWVAAQPHVLRLWVTNLRFQGKIVWVGHISTPLGGRFAESEDGDSVPIIDPNVRRCPRRPGPGCHLLAAALGNWLRQRCRAVSASSPRKTPGGSSYFTDGLRAVMIFESDPISMTEIEIMSWENPDQD